MTGGYPEPEDPGYERFLAGLGLLCPDNPDGLTHDYVYETVYAAGREARFSRCRHCGDPA